MVGKFCCRKLLLESGNLYYFVCIVMNEINVLHEKKEIYEPLGLAISNNSLNISHVGVRNRNESPRFETQLLFLRV